MTRSNGRVFGGFLGTGYDFRTLFVLSIVGILLLTVAVTTMINPTAPASGHSTPVVTLRGFPGNGSVQMFDTLDTGAKVIAEIPDGTVCDSFKGPLDGSEDGIRMSFYFVQCGDTIGFVNARWVES